MGLQGGGGKGEGRISASSCRTSANVTVVGCAVPEFLALCLADALLGPLPTTLAGNALHSSTPSALHALRMALITVPRMSSAADQISMSNSAVPPTSSRAERTAMRSATRRTPARRAMARFVGSDARII